MNKLRNNPSFIGSVMIKWNTLDENERQRIRSESLSVGNGSHEEWMNDLTTGHQNWSAVGQEQQVGMCDDMIGSVPLESTLCSVCGDIAAGFHCGAYVCEACKKFFVRCLKHDNGLKFACANDRQCEITKETRTQCPHCRYQKCLSLGMYRPGGPNVSDDIGHIPCKVCGAPSSGFHFGAITCEGCKGFFRRTVKERGNLKYACSREGQCTITWKTRNVCKFCRYQRCIDAGMKPDKSRIGRQPNSIKHATMLELHSIKAAKGLVEPGDVSSSTSVSGRSEAQCLPKIEPYSDNEEESIYENEVFSFSRIRNHSTGDLTITSAGIFPHGSNRVQSIGRKHKNKDYLEEQKVLDEYGKRRGAIIEASNRSGDLPVSSFCLDSFTPAVRSVGGVPCNTYQHCINSSGNGDAIINSTGIEDSSNSRHVDIFAQAKNLLDRLSKQNSATNSFNDQTLSNRICNKNRESMENGFSNRNRESIENGCSNRNGDAIINGFNHKSEQSRTILRQTSHDRVSGLPNKPYDLVDAVQQCNFIENSHTNTPLVDHRSFNHSHVDRRSSNDSHIDCRSSYESHVDRRSSHDSHIDCRSSNDSHIDRRSSNDSHVDRRSSNDSHIDCRSSNDSHIDRRSSNDSHISRSSNDSHIDRRNSINTGDHMRQANVGYINSPMYPGREDWDKIYPRIHPEETDVLGYAQNSIYSKRTVDNCSSDDMQASAFDGSLDATENSAVVESTKIEWNVMSRSASGDELKNSESSSSSTATPSSSLMDYDSVIGTMKRAYADLTKILVRPEELTPLTYDSTEMEMWDSQMSTFANIAGIVLKFAKKVPGFRTFTLEEQIETVQNFMFPIVLVMFSTEYDVRTRAFNWFNYSQEEFHIIMSRFDVFGALVPWFHKMGNILHELNIDETELSFLCGLCLLNAGNKSDYKELLLDALNEHCSNKYSQYADNEASTDTGEGPGSSRYRTGRILMCLRYMSEADLTHQQVISQLVTDKKYEHLKLPQLYKESFIGMDD